MVIDLREYTPSVLIDLNPGIYVFRAFSSEGKTYLSSLLRSLRKDERVDSCTYVDDFYPEKFFDRSKRDLVMLDRYDLYVGQGELEMKEFAKTGVVLVDCKSSKHNSSFWPCTLEFSERGLFVYDSIRHRG